MNVDPTTPRSNLRRPFYSYVSILAGVVVFARFFRTFYLKAACDTPVLPTLLHVHGVVMTLWFAVFILQVRLERPEWRIRFRVRARTVTVDEIVTGYRNSQLEMRQAGEAASLDVHRAFLLEFP